MGDSADLSWSEGLSLPLHRLALFTPLQRIQGRESHMYQDRVAALEGRRRLETGGVVTGEKAETRPSSP